MTDAIIRFDTGVPIDTAGLEAPKWNQLFVKGKFFREDFPDGIDLTEKTFRSMKANWEEAGRPKLCVDYFHWGASNVTAVGIDDKIASGWIVDLRIVDGVLQGLIEWTEKARAKIEAKELSCFSPYFHMNPMSRTSGKRQGPTIFGGGLLNDPFLQSLPPVAASASPPTPATAKPKEQPMKDSFKKKLQMAIGFADDASEDDIECSFEKFIAKKKDEKVTASVGDTAEAISLAVQPVKVALAEANAKAVELASKVAALEKEKTDTRITAFTDKLLADGKLLPAAKERVIAMAQKLGVEETEKFFADMPPVVQLGKQSVISTGKEASPTDAVKQFNGIVDTIVKEQNVSRTRANEIAMQSHVELATLAFSTPAPAKS